jgi:ubiquinone/menaquinone biosynthesis C-methylase UbiE
MSFLTAFFYDRVMSTAERACLADWRRELLAHAHGEVLEVGAGTGASLEFYPDSVSSLVLSEPDPHMRKQLSERVERSQRRENSRVCAGSAEQIEAGDESFDCVVTSLVCCSVNDLEAGLLEIRRVLRHGGSFLFMEHVAAEQGTSRRRWQNRINPLWKRMMGNCHLNRETEQAILAAGFEITRIERESMRKVLPIVRPTIRGAARKA